LLEETLFFEKEAEMTILVTGGTGHLGRTVVALLKRDGHHVRVLARRPGDDPEVDWARGDLATGEGIANAMRGVEAVVHAATNSPAARRGRFRMGDFVHSPADVDVRGTEALLRAAEEAAVAHFVHVSIVGLQHIARMPYARVKLEAEELVRSAAVPWSIVRATGFYWLLDRMLARMAARPVVILPAGVRMQSVDSDEFAQLVAEYALDGARGEGEDFAGPQALTMRQYAEQYLAARGLRRRIWEAAAPRRVRDALTAANTVPMGRLGTTTWVQWLARRSQVTTERQPAAAGNP
jgi:uncharacterized protein YbjT (DUF2867 family)